MKPEAEKNGYTIPNLDRAFVLIEHLADLPAGATLPELVESLGISKSSLFRIIHTLQARGYIIRNRESGRFMLGRRFLSIGLSTLSEQSLIENSIHSMRDLRDEVNETVLLGVMLDQEGVLLEQVMGNHPFTFSLAPGKPFNLHASAPGKAILAFLPESECQHIVERIVYTPYTNRTLKSAVKLKEELVQVREKGYAFDRAEELEGVHCVGAPIFDHQGYPIAAVWITGPSGRVRQNRMDAVGVRVAQAAKVISTSYGYARKKGHENA